MKPSAIVGIAVSLLIASSLTPTPATVFALSNSTDFNGDGYEDLAVHGSGGSVNVIYGTSGGLAASQAKDGTGRADQEWSQNSSGIEGTTEVFENFGTSLTSGDFNSDGYSDLAIGVPSESLDGVEDAGAVNVIYGSSQGLKASAVGAGNGRADQIWSQDSTGIEGAGEAKDAFGWALASADFNKDGYHDLAIGVIGENSKAGAVNVIYGSSQGLRSTAVSAGNGLSDQLWMQGAGGVEGGAESGDEFGFTLTAGDYNKDGYADLAIGTPFEHLGAAQYAGALNVIYGSSQGLKATAVANGNGRADQLWTQDNSGIEETVGELDHFSYALSSGDFNKDGYDDLAIGAPTDDFGGVVNVIYGSSLGLRATAVAAGDGHIDQLWSRDSAGIESLPEFGNWFGATLAADDFNKDGYDDLVIAVINQMVNAHEHAGAVNVIYGSSDGLRATAVAPGNGRTDQFWNRNSVGVEGVADGGDRFGYAIV